MGQDGITISIIRTPYGLSGHSIRIRQTLGRTVEYSVLAHLGSSTIAISTKNTLTFGLFNIHSINNKAPMVLDLLKDCKFDLFCLTETWQQQNSQVLSMLANPMSWVEVVVLRCFTIRNGRCPPYMYLLKLLLNPWFYKLMGLYLLL